MAKMLRAAAVLMLAVFSATVAAQDTTVFVNVSVVPMSQDIVLQHQSVVVSGGTISAIGDVDSVAVPKHAFVVDGTDRYLMPGLAEMHAHVTSTSPQSFGRLATLFVANGVTTIRGMLGRDSHLQLREQLANETVFGPRLVTSGPSFNGRSVAGASQAERMVRAQHEAGFDFLKVHPGLSAAEFSAMANTANEIGIPYAGHISAAVGIKDALRLDMATIDHLDGYFAALLPASHDGAGGFGGFFDVMLARDLDPSQIPALAAATAAAGTWVVPTEVLIEHLIDNTSSAELRQRPENRYVSKRVVDTWIERKEAQLGERGFDIQTAALAVELRRRIILELHRAGAGLLLGSDAPQTFNVPGFSLHRELKTLVDAGLSPYDALRTGTIAVAEFLGSNGGEVAVGKDADLLLLDANPLVDIGNSDRIHGVMLRGQWLSASELAKRLQQFDVSGD